MRNQQLRPSTKNNSISAKLSDEDVVTIIKLLQDSNKSLRAIGREFNIDNSIIVRINSGKAWNNITEKYVSEFPIRKR